MEHMRRFLVLMVQKVIGNAIKTVLGLAAK